MSLYKKIFFSFFLLIATTNHHLLVAASSSSHILFEILNKYDSDETATITFDETIERLKQAINQDNVNAINQEGKSILHELMQYVGITGEQFEIILDMCMQHDFNINQKNQNGQTLLMLAFNFPDEEIELKKKIIRSLIKDGADIFIPLNQVIEYSKSIDSQNHLHIKICKNLLENISIA